MNEPQTSFQWYKTNLLICLLTPETSTCFTHYFWWFMGNKQLRQHAHIHRHFYPYRWGIIVWGQRKTELQSWCFIVKYWWDGRLVSSYLATRWDKVRRNTLWQSMLGSLWQHVIGVYPPALSLTCHQINVTQLLCKLLGVIIISWGSETVAAWFCCFRTGLSNMSPFSRSSWGVGA